MNLKAMNFFLSDENIKNHLEHLRTAKLKYSILEKSISEIKGKTMQEISLIKVSSEVRKEALSLLWYIRSHEIFFDSFSDTAKKVYASKEKLLYDIFVQAKEKEYGFLYIYTDKWNNPGISFLSGFERSFLKYEPKLCIDLYEHTYFSDYGFKKDMFLKNALTYLDTGKL